MKTLILGSKGMLGTALTQAFSDYRPIGWGMMDLDITDKERVQKKIELVKPDLIVNAAAYTDVDMSETATDLANKVNGDAVGYIAEVAQKINAIFVHFSTDYVFDGKKKEGYQEDDLTIPVNAYGRSKLKGEEEVTGHWSPVTGHKFYLIRTSWLYGSRGKNFVDTIVEKSKTNRFLKVVNDQFGRPTFTNDLAKMTREIIESKKSFGTYHITNSTGSSGISWYEFSKKIVEITKAPCDIVPCSTKEYPTLAIRPQYSVLQNTKLPLLRAWDKALKEYLTR
jgi:dTDP-4-dehydrorhamnose reductase